MFRLLVVLLFFCLCLAWVDTKEQESEKYIMKRGAFSEREGKQLQKGKNTAKGKKKSNKRRNTLDRNTKKKRKALLKKVSKGKTKEAKQDLNNRQQRTRLSKPISNMAEKNIKTWKANKKTKRKKESKSRKSKNPNSNNNGKGKARNKKENKKDKRMKYVKRKSKKNKRRFQKKEKKQSKKKRKKQLRNPTCESKLAEYSSQYEKKARTMERVLTRIGNRRKFLKNKNKKKEEFNGNFKILLSTLGGNISAPECSGEKDTKFSGNCIS